MSIKHFVWQSEAKISNAKNKFNLMEQCLISYAKFQI